MRAKPVSCAGCVCESHGTDFSAVEGSGANGVMIVAEASGEQEQRDCLPLRPYAPAGSLLQRTFDRLGLRRESFAITNVLRCRPRRNWLEGAPWEVEAIRRCRPNLDEAIRRYRPRAILTLGDLATRELAGVAGPGLGVSYLNGYVLPGPAGSDGRPIPVLPSFHPAFLRRGKAALQGVFSRTLLRAVRVASGADRDWLWLQDAVQNAVPTIQDVLRDAQLHYSLHPSRSEAESFLRWVESAPARLLSYDLETGESSSLDEDAREGFTDTQVRLAQFSFEEGQAIAMPWEVDYQEVIARLLRTPNPKAGHNCWVFDNKVLEATSQREGMDLRPRGTVHDTMCMFGHWQPDLPRHLQFASQFVSFPFPWKHLAAGSIEFYGCCDADATRRLAVFLESALRKEGLWGDEAACEVTVQ